MRLNDSAPPSSETSIHSIRIFLAQIASLRGRFELVVYMDHYATDVRTCSLDQSTVSVLVPAVSVKFRLSNGPLYIVISA